MEGNTSKYVGKIEKDQALVLQKENVLPAGDEFVCQLLTL